MLHRCPRWLADAKFCTYLPAILASPVEFAQVIAQLRDFLADRPHQFLEQLERVAKIRLEAVLQLGRGPVAVVDVFEQAGDVDIAIAPGGGAQNQLALVQECHDLRFETHLDLVDGVHVRPCARQLAPQSLAELDRLEDEGNDAERYLHGDKLTDRIVF